ncbi:MAG: TMEM165/GDT1 family protein [Thermosediminibacteraceae bacterium]|nr:TMEM165/GDT1 family protein [Thermosediminibacteraceae bacterium]
MDLKLFFTAFALLFLAELGDKTQLTVFTLVTQYNKPLPIFLGASVALVLVTFLGALFGHVVTRYVPANYMKVIAGVLFVGIGAFLLLEGVPQLLQQLGKR